MASRYGTLSETSAASRTTGLALKATPRPAFASMSRSLAPSPMATVWERGTPAAAAKRSSALGLPRPVDDRADETAGEAAVDDLQRVGRRVVEAELGGERRRSPG